jgi:hypothetical protein
LLSGGNGNAVLTVNTGGGTSLGTYTIVGLGSAGPRQTVSRLP